MVRGRGPEFAALFAATLSGAAIDKAYADKSAAPAPQVEHAQKNKPGEAKSRTEHAPKPHHEPQVGIDFLSASAGEHSTTIGAAIAAEVPKRVGQADCYIGGKVGVGAELENHSRQVIGQTLSAEASVVCHPDAFGKAPVYVGAQANLDAVLPAQNRTPGIRGGGGPRGELHLNHGKVVLGLGITAQDGVHSRLIDANPAEKPKSGPEVIVDTSVGFRVDVPWLSGKK